MSQTNPNERSARPSDRASIAAPRPSGRTDRVIPGASMRSGAGRGQHQGENRSGRCCLGRGDGLKRGAGRLADTHVFLATSFLEMTWVAK